MKQLHPMMIGVIWAVVLFSFFCLLDHTSTAVVLMSLVNIAIGGILLYRDDRVRHSTYSK